MPFSLDTALKSIHGWLALVGLTCLFLGGCGGETEPVTDTYQVRGQIVSLPVEGDPASGLRIHHEPIPTFVGEDGQMVGMDAMTMGFTPATGVSLERLDVGDKVAFTLRVNFAANRIEVAEFKELAGDTELDFGGPGDGAHGHDHSH